MTVSINAGTGGEPPQGHQPAKGSAPATAAGRRRLPVRDLAWLVAGLALLAVGIWLPALPVYVVGGLTTAVGVAVIIFRMCRGRDIARPRLLLAATVVLATLVAAGIITAPRLALSRMDGPFMWRWSERAAAREVRVLPQALLVTNSSWLWGLDPETGDEKFKIRKGIGGRVSAGPDGSFTVVTDTEVTYHGPDGAQRWKQPVPEDQEAVAVDDGVVLRDCVKSQCVYTGYGPSGTRTWTATGLRGQFQNGPVANYDETLRSPAVHVVPTVVAIPTTPAADPRPPAPGATGTTTVRGVDGRTLATVPGDVVAVVGDTVVLKVGGCQISAVRDGRGAWTTQGLPCTKFPAAFFETRGYLSTHTDDAITGTVTVDLDDGQWRVTPPLHLTSVGDGLPDATTGVAGDEIWVERRDQTITGVDAATGRTLWAYRTPGDRIPGLDVRHGAVAVLSGADERLTELAGADDPRLVTVLDARTGRPTARLIMPHPDRLWDVTGTGPGRAFIESKDETGMIGRA